MTISLKGLGSSQSTHATVDEHPGDAGARADRQAARTGRFDAKRFRDVRWIVGVLLLLVGFGGSLRIVQSFDDAVTVWSAKRQLLPGDKVTAADLVPTKVRMEGATRRYYSAQHPGDVVVQRPIGVGEIIPAGAVGPGHLVDVREVAVRVDVGNVDVLKQGALVELWVAEKRSENGANGYVEPHKVTDRAVVSHVGSRSGGVVSVAEGQPVQVLVPGANLAQTIHAANSDARITLVPVVAGQQK